MKPDTSRSHVRSLALYGALGLAVIAALVVAGGAVRAGGPALAPVALDAGAAAALPGLPADVLGSLGANRATGAPGTAGATARADGAGIAGNEPALDPRAAVPAQQDVREPLDGFESPGWPDAARWPFVADLEAIARGEPGGGAPWATSACTASEGGRALRAASDGRPCDAGYPAGAASSALLSLDLAHTAYDQDLALSFDAWLDADADEGLLIHYVRFDDDGATAERRLIWSGTGRIAGWVHGVAIDLTALGDRYDPSWSGDLRGRRAFLEFLFRSGDGSAGRGALVDALALHRRTAPPTPTPSATATTPPTATSAPPTATAPGPGVVRTNACTASSDCVQLSVRAFVDHRCDGRLQPGVDAPLRAEPAPRVDVAAGQEILGAPLSSSGTVIFLFPAVPEAEVALAMPDGYEACPGIDNPALVPATAFQRGQARLDFRVRRGP